MLDYPLFYRRSYLRHSSAPGKIKQLEKFFIIKGMKNMREGSIVILMKDKRLMAFSSLILRGLDKRKDNKVLINRRDKLDS